jgi:hypothetical protein
MHFLLSPPGAGLIPFIFLLIAIVISSLVISYFAGFRNGKREGERLQLQKQVDTTSKKEPV